MEFALNFSDAAEALRRTGAIALDRYKLPFWEDTIAQVAAIAPVYVHFPLSTFSASMPNASTLLANSDWTAIERTLAQTNTAYVNLHLIARGDAFPDVPEAELTAAVTERLIADVASVVARFGAERVIVENVPYGRRSQERSMLRAAIDPAVIHAVLDATGCGLLLDLAHATISARNLDTDPIAYIDSLPIDRAREIHVTGIALIDGAHCDHYPMTDPDWAILAWYLEQVAAGRSHPTLIACEYGGIGPGFAERTDPAVIAADSPRIYAAIRAVRAKPTA